VPIREQYCANKFDFIAPVILTDRDMNPKLVSTTAGIKISKKGIRELEFEIRIWE